MMTDEKQKKGIKISKGVIRSILLVPSLLYIQLMIMTLSWNNATLDEDIAAANLQITGFVEEKVNESLAFEGSSTDRLEGSKPHSLLLIARNETKEIQSTEPKNKTNTENGGGVAKSNSHTLLVSHKTNKEKGGFWPKGCTWQCYLRNNQELLKMFGDNPKAAKRHWRRYGKKENRPCACKVVLLAGPHKAASTTLQWVSTVYASMLNLQWQWLVPDSYSQKEWKWSPIKSFAPFVFTYFGTKDKAKNMTFEELKDTYRKEFARQWNEENNNIIFGSEQIDMAADLKYKDKDLIKEILDIVPDTAVQSITTVVVYRSTRISHVKSLWKEIGGWHNSSFYQFLLHEDNEAFTRFYHSVDSLRLATAFLEKGMNVKLLDLSGINTKANKEDLYTIFGCDILELQCKSTKDKGRVPAVLSQHTPKDAERLVGWFTAPQNVRYDTNVVNVTDNQMNQIDELLRRYDCTYEKWIHQSDQLKILNGNMIFTHMEECKTIFKDKQLNQEDLFRLIKSVLLDGEDNKSSIIENGDDVAVAVSTQ